MEYELSIIDRHRRLEATSRPCRQFWMPFACSRHKTFYPFFWL